MMIKTVNLGELISPAKVRRCNDDEYPVLSMTMHDGIVLQSERFKKSLASLDQSNYKVVSRGQLVVGFPIDEGVIYVQNAADEGIMSPAYGVWDIHAEKVLPEYLECCLHSPQSMSYYMSKLKGTTARRRSITTEDLLSLPISLPDKSEQRRRLSLLSSCKDTISKSEQQLAKLDELVKSRFVEMFGDPISHLDRGETKQLDRIAERITVGFVGEASNDYVEAGVPYLRTQNVRVNHIDLEGLIYVNESFHKKNSKSIIRPGDIVISRVGANRGMAAVIPESLPEANIANCLIVGRTNLIDSCYLAFYLNMSYGKRPQFGASVGSAQGVVNTSVLKKWEIYVPEKKEQKEFVEYVNQVDKSKLAVKQSLEKLETLKKSLMQQYFG